MATITTSADGRKIKAAVAAGETTAPVYVSPDCVVTVTPGSGGVMLAQATWSSEADVAAGAGRWFDWDASTVSVAAVQALTKATAVRFIATTAAGVAEVSR